MRIVITGATGFIGRALCRELSGDYEVVALSRDSRRATEVLGPGVRVVEWDGRTTSGWAGEVVGARAVINLAGENVAAGRWSQATMNSIRQSRVHSTRAILDALEAAPSKPEVFVQASGVGYFGACGDEVLDEDAPVGEGFLADVGRRAEAEAVR